MDSGYKLVDALWQVAIIIVVLLLAAFIIQMLYTRWLYVPEEPVKEPLAWRDIPANEDDGNWPAEWPDEWAGRPSASLPQRHRDPPPHYPPDPIPYIHNTSLPHRLINLPTYNNDHTYPLRQSAILPPPLAEPTI